MCIIIYIMIYVYIYILYVCVCVCCVGELRVHCIFVMSPHDIT